MITLNEVGWQGTASADKACQGEDVHINGRIVHRVVEYSTSLITITVESFLITHKTISAEYSAECLQCPASMGKCAGASHAYNWDHLVVPPCQWKLAQNLHRALDEKSFFSNHNALLFQLGDLSIDPRCPGLQLRPTGFPEPGPDPGQATSALTHWSRCALRLPLLSLRRVSPPKIVRFRI